MALHAVSHVAVVVDDLRAAEVYYGRLLGLEVAFREARTVEGWRTLGADDDPAEAEMAMLGSGGVVVGLEAGSVSGRGVVDHVGLTVDPEDIARARGALGAAERVRKDRPDLLMFDDRYGVAWELDTRRYDDAAAMTSAAPADRRR